MIPPDAKPWPHTCPNEVYLAKHNGEQLIHAVIPWRVYGRRVAVCTPELFAKLDKLFAGWPWILSSEQPSFRLYHPSGRMETVFISRVADYLKQQEEHAAGILKEPPSSTRWEVHNNTGDRLNLTDFSRGEPKVGRRKLTAATGEIVEWRQKQAEGGDTDALYSGEIKRSRSRKWGSR